MVDIGSGGKSGVKVYLSVFLEVMVAWVRTVLVYLNCEEEDGSVGGKWIYNQVSILTYLELALLHLDDQINIF